MIDIDVKLDDLDRKRMSFTYFGVEVFVSDELLHPDNRIALGQWVSRAVHVELEAVGRVLIELVGGHGDGKVYVVRSDMGILRLPIHTRSGWGEVEYRRSRSRPNIFVLNGD